MSNLTLSIPDELKRKMESFPELNWSEVARQAIWKKVNDLEIINKFAMNSNLTEKDAIIIGKKINRALSKNK